jgi:hypothetical protein
MAVAQALLFVFLVFLVGIAVGMWWANRAFAKVVDELLPPGPVVGPHGSLLTKRGQPADDDTGPVGYGTRTPVKDWMNEVSPEEEWRVGKVAKDVSGRPPN